MQPIRGFIRLVAGCLLLLLLTGAGLAPPAVAGVAPGACAQRSVDLVLVLDDSGSMSAATEEHNDPDNLRITAAHLMIDLLDADDRAGLVLFSDQLREVSPLAPVGAARSDLHDRINRFQSSGGTRLDRAVEAALAQLPAAGDRPLAILLLTDGRPDVDPAGQDARLTALAEQARRNGVELYVIGLGASYDRTLLEKLTSVSKSQQLWHVVQADHLSTAFLEILRNLKGLNIETATDGKLPVLGLSPEVQFAALRGRGDGPVKVDWPGGTPINSSAAPGLSAAVAYTYDLQVYKPKAAGPATVTVKAPVAWKIERPPLAAQFLTPTARQEVDSGEDLIVQVALTPCGAGTAIPQGVQGAVTVLDADRHPTAAQTTLTADAAGTLTGALTMPAAAGTYVLSARILTAEGRQITVAEQTVTAAPHDRWLIEAPPVLATGAEGSVTVRHRFGGRPAPAESGVLTATLPDGTTRTLALTAGEPGTWTATVTAPPDRTGTIRYVLGDGKATASTKVEPVRLVLKDLPTPQWSFLGSRKPAAVTLKGETTGPVANATVLPPYGGPGLEMQSWQGGGPTQFTAPAEFLLARPPSWWSLRDLFLGRGVTLNIQPKTGPYLDAEPATIQGRVAPLLPWYWLLLGLVLAGAIGIWIRRRLYGGPQLPIAIAAAGGKAVWLQGRRPGIITRFLHPRTQKEITVGGSASKAAVILKELPPDALLRIVARGIPGRERFRVENLNRNHAMVFKGLFQRSRISLKGRGPAPAITLADLPIQLDLHPKAKRRQTRR